MHKSEADKKGKGTGFAQLGWLVRQIEAARRLDSFPNFAMETNRLETLPTRPGGVGRPQFSVSRVFSFAISNNNTNWLGEPRWLAVQLPTRLTAKEAPA